jgi:hypothetical protein
MRSPPASTSRLLRVVAGFQVSISGRFWVSTEAVVAIIMFQRRSVWIYGLEVGDKYFENAKFEFFVRHSCIAEYSLGVVESLGILTVLTLTGMLGAHRASNPNGTHRAYRSWPGGALPFFGFQSQRV